MVVGEARPPPLPLLPPAVPPPPTEWADPIRGCTPLALSRPSALLRWDINSDMVRAKSGAGRE